MAPTPDLAGLSLGGAYQAGLQAGFQQFRVTAYRQSWAQNTSYLWREVAPTLGYVLQTTSAGSGGMPLDSTPPDGSFYTLQPEPGVPDQTPEPGEEVTPASVLSFAFMTSDTDTHLSPSETVRSGIDPDTSVTAWWEYEFQANATPGGLQAEMLLYNGPPRTPVDVSGLMLAQTAVDPLLVFTNPPVPEPADLLADVPQFERQSYEIRAVLRVVANELARVEAAQAALIQNWFPMSADLLLPRFEQMLGLPVNPPTEDLQTRRNIVLAYLQALRTEGRGIDWAAAISSLAGSSWNYAEHDPANPDSPAPYTVDVNIPQVLARVGWNLVRDVTPAHIVINPGYTGGWLVGISNLWSEGPWDDNEVDDVL